VQSEEINVLEKRKADFQQLHEELIPALIQFIEQMEIKPAHQVLGHAPTIRTFSNSWVS